MENISCPDTSAISTFFNKCEISNSHLTHQYKVQNINRLIKI